MHQFLRSHQFQTEALHLDQEHLHLVSHILKSNGPNSESSKLGIKIGSREMVFEVPIGTKLQFLKIRSLRGCLVCIFKQQFSVFKQHFTHFNTLFHPHVFLQMFLNNNF